MPVKKRKKPVAQLIQESNGSLIPKIIAALLGVGAVGGTGLSYATGQHADERTAVVETKLERVKEDAKEDRKDIKRIDRRTIRMELQMDQIADKVGAKKLPKHTGPVDEPTP